MMERWSTPEILEANELVEPRPDTGHSIYGIFADQMGWLGRSECRLIWAV